MDGIGCNTELLNEVFCTLSNAEIKEMKEAFEKSSDSRLVLLNLYCVIIGLE
jgi:hypothetical protein